MPFSSANISSSITQPQINLEAAVFYDFCSKSNSNIILRYCFFIDYRYARVSADNNGFSDLNFIIVLIKAADVLENFSVYFDRAEIKAADIIE